MATHGCDLLCICPHTDDAEIARLALDGLRRHGSGTDPGASATETERITAALRVLLRIRRTGVPTATAAAIAVPMFSGISK